MHSIDKVTRWGSLAETGDPSIETGITRTQHRCHICALLPSSSRDHTCILSQNGLSSVFALATPLPTVSRAGASSLPLLSLCGSARPAPLLSPFKHCYLGFSSISGSFFSSFSPHLAFPLVYQWMHWFRLILTCATGFRFHVVNHACWNTFATMHAGTRLQPCRLQYHVF